MTAQAAPIVIYDSGNTHSIKQHTAVLQDEPLPDFGQLWFNSKMRVMRKAKSDAKDWFPLVTRKMSAGRLGNIGPAFHHQHCRTFIHSWYRVLPLLLREGVHPDQAASCGN